MSIWLPPKWAHVGGECKSTQAMPSVSVGNGQDGRRMPKLFALGEVLAC